MSTRELPLEEVLRHGAWLRRFAEALVRDEDHASDVTQDTLVTAWRNPPLADARPRSWLARVAQNRARDLHRSDLRRRTREQESAEDPPAPGTPEQLLGDLELHRRVATLVTALPEPFRETVVLRYYEGLTAAEIATRLRVPAGTVRWRLKEGLDRVRAALDAQHGGDRRTWVLALTPLLPRAEGSARPEAASSSARRGLPVRAIGAGVIAAMAAGLALVVTARGPAGSSPDPTEALVEANTETPAARPALAPVPPRLEPAEEATDEAPPPEGPAAADPESLIRYMLAAIADGSYDLFLTYAGDELKAVLHKETLTELSATLGPRLARGYTLHDFGTLRQEGRTIHLWKVELADGEDDHLLRVTIDAGRASTFLIQ